MPFFLHSAVKVETYYFPLPVQRHIEALDGGVEIRNRAIQAHPHGKVSCYLGVGGVMCEARRYRGFADPMPKMPNILDLEHGTIYRDGLAQMREHWREDQALAAACGGIAGIVVGIAVMGIASLFTSHMAIVALPIAMGMPGALAVWAPELHRMRVKDRRLSALITVMEGLERPHVPNDWRQAVEAAHECGYSSDPFLREICAQFVEAKGNMLPRYDELGIYLPTYFPPDDDSPLNAYAAVARNEFGSNT